MQHALAGEARLMSVLLLFPVSVAFLWMISRSLTMLLREGPEGCPSASAVKAEARSNGKYKRREEIGGARGQFDTIAYLLHCAIMASYASQAARTVCESAVLTPSGMNAYLCNGNTAFIKSKAVHSPS